VVYSDLKQKTQSAFAQATASGIGSVAGAASALMTTTSDIHHWAETSKTASAEVWNTANLQAHTLALAGDTLAKDAVTAAIAEDQWIPDFPFVSTLVGAQNSFKQQDFQNVMAVLSLAVNAFTSIYGMMKPPGAPGGGGDGGGGMVSGNFMGFGGSGGKGGGSVQTPWGGRIQ